jgi:hypothetical protein
MTRQAKSPRACEPQIVRQTRRNPFFPKKPSAQKVSEKPHLANLAKKKQTTSRQSRQKEKKTDNPFQKTGRTLTRKKKETNNQRVGLTRSQLAPPATPA